MIKRVIGVLLIVVVLAALLPVLIPLMLDQSEGVTNLTDDYPDDSSVAFLAVMWPIALIVIVIGIGAGVIFFALRRFGVLN